LRGGNAERLAGRSTVSLPASTNGESKMEIQSAVIRVTDLRVHVDVVVDGQEQRSFVIYDGNTEAHEEAAVQYLFQSIGLPFRKIGLVDERSEEEVEEVSPWRPDPIYSAGLAYAAGYPD